MTAKPRRTGIVLVACCVAASVHPARAADNFFAFDLTTNTTFNGLYLAPAGTDGWGPNQALNDKDKSLDPSERLRLTGIARGKYDVKLVDAKGRVCIKKNVDLTRDLTFDIQDADIAGCR